jgi:hypothetical protein
LLSKGKAQSGETSRNFIDKNSHDSQLRVTKLKIFLPIQVISNKEEYTQQRE